MKCIAEITDGSVTNLAKIASDAPIPDGWVDGSGVARIGDTYDGETFTRPAAPLIPFEDAKGEALAEVNATHAGYLRQLTERATPEERDTWPAKSAAATAYLANTATDAQSAFIEAAASRRGIAPAEMAQIISTKADAFLGYIGQAEALCEPARVAVKATATHDALQAALEAFRAEAQAAFDALTGG